MTTNDLLAPPEDQLLRVVDYHSPCEFFGGVQIRIAMAARNLTRRRSPLPTVQDGIELIVRSIRRSYECKDWIVEARRLNDHDGVLVVIEPNGDCFTVVKYQR